MIIDRASTWRKAGAFAASVACLSSLLIGTCEGHGMMTSPRSRNEYAWQFGIEGQQPGVPRKEYCSHCLNNNSGVCGKSTNWNYDSYIDSVGNPMPWISQETYLEGQEIIVKSYMSTHHNGHIEVYACADGSASTMSCFMTPGHALTFVRDPAYGMPADPAYPERGYLAGGQAGSLKEFEMIFKLPNGIKGDKVMLHWKYITANSCLPPGYSAYFNGVASSKPSGYWSSSLGGCSPPYPVDGTRSSVWPEQFFNCAEVTILANAPTVSPAPSSSPVTNAPTISRAPVKSPTKSPTRPPTVASTSLKCSAAYTMSSWDALLKMQSLTYRVSTTPNVLALQAAGGAAGSGNVVSESQAYAVLASAIALASLEPTDANYGNAKSYFEGYFNGWKKMCQNSLSQSSCQSVKYCGGNPCLPGWKHAGDLSSVVGTGAAPDGDEDAILGMIIAVRALEAKSPNNLPTWYNEVKTWADQSCTQFIQDNTVLSSTKSHRLVKLGSCWGGWDTAGNNPSYHAPGHYRVFRDFQASITSRSYTLPSLGGQTLKQAWDMLIDTSYKFLETTQCPNTGLVPNWALVKEDSSTTLSKQVGSFSGSGTPQYEFGAEASRTLWRVAVDALLYPTEAAWQAGDFLAPLQSKMVANFDPWPADATTYFKDATLEPCSPTVSNVFGSWQWNGFIFGPVLSVLATPLPAGLLTGSFTQQQMVDKACTKVSTIAAGTSYYPLSWQVLATMTLNGGVAKAAQYLSSGPYPPSAPTPTAPSPTPPTPTTPTPPTGGQGCCTIDFKNCSPTVAGACSASEDACVNMCFKYWLPNGAITGCKARWAMCSASSECCSPLNCINGQCLLSTDAPTPTAPVPSPVAPVSSPTAPVAPVPAPTAPVAPVPAPTAPVPAPPTSGTACCTQKFDSCVTWYGTTEAQCKAASTYGTDVFWAVLQGGTCKARWDQCSVTATNPCCSGLTCVGNNSYAQCMVSTTPTAPTPTAPVPSPVAPVPAPVAPVPAPVAPVPAPVAPVPAPVAPVPAPVAPVSAPTSNTQMCCSDLGGWACRVADPTDWCNLSKANCEGSCNGKYINPSGPPPSCIMKWGACLGKETQCCAGATCQGDQWYKQCR